MDFSRSSSPLSSLTSTLGNLSNTGSNLTSALSNSINGMFNNKTIYIGLIIVVIVCIGLAWTLYYIISSKIFSLAKVVSNETLKPLLCNQKYKYAFKFDKSSNGERRSFTFWIYLHDLNVGRNMYKNVFNVSSDKENIEIGKCSPYVFLDKTNNSMYIRFAKLKTTFDGSLNIKYTDLDNRTLLNNFMKTGLVIPYIPLQRWVHVCVVCNANSYKSYMYVYIDGDLVNMSSTGEYEKQSSMLKDVLKDYRDLDLNIDGFLTIGGTSTDLTEGPGFSGLITKITTFNYELNQQDIFDNYYEGPIGGLLAKLGLANYGLRSPIYKIS